MRNYIAAIDLGTTKVVTMVGEKSETGFKVIACVELPSKGVMRGEVVNIQNVLDSLKPALEEISKTHSIEIKEVFVGIAGQNIRCSTAGMSRNRSFPGELIEKQEIEEMIAEIAKSRVEVGEKILHVIPQHYNVDDHMGVDCASGMTGTTIEGAYKLFIGKVNSVEQTKHVLSRAGLNLKKLILEPVASAKAVLTDDEKELGVAMIDMGGGTTDLLIYHENKIRHAAVIPFGGNSITEDLRQGCSVSLKNAEQIKIQFGSCFSEFAPAGSTVVIPGIGGVENREVSFKVIAGIIEARVEEIIEAITYEIEESGYEHKLSSGIVLTGGGSELSNIKQLFQARTGYSVRIASPMVHLSHDTPQEYCKPSLSTALGLIMVGEEELSKERDSMVTQVSGTLFNNEEMEREPVAQKVKKEPRAPKSQGKGKLTKVMSVIGTIFDTTNNDA